MSLQLGLGWLSSVITNYAGRFDPYLAFNFAIEIEGLLVGGFSEIDGLSGEVEVEEYREGGVNGFIHKFPRQTTYPPLRLRRGLSDTSALWNWYHNVTQGIIKRRNGTIVVLDSEQLPVMWWNFRHAYPTRWIGSQFRANANEVAFEEVELIHQGLIKPALGQAVALARGLSKFGS